MLEMKKGGFGAPVPGPVRSGDSVWFINTDTVRRGIQTDHNEFETPNIDPGKAVGVWLQLPPGKYPFHDHIYPQFKGTLEILP